MTAVIGERGFFRSGGMLGLGALAALCVVTVSGCAHAPSPSGLIPHLGSKPASANRRRRPASG